MNNRPDHRNAHMYGYDCFIAVTEKGKAAARDCLNIKCQCEGKRCWWWVCGAPQDELDENDKTRNPGKGNLTCSHAKRNEDATGKDDEGKDRSSQLE